MTVGPVTYTLSRFICGLQGVNTSGERIKPQGQFCRLSITVKNSSKRPVTIRSDNIALRDAEQNVYAASQDTEWLEEVLFSELINPGNSLSRVIYYDLPKTRRPVSATCTSVPTAPPQIVALR